MSASETDMVSMQSRLQPADGDRVPQTVTDSDEGRGSHHIHAMTRLQCQCHGVSETAIRGPACCHGGAAAGTPDPASHLDLEARSHGPPQALRLRARSGSESDRDRQARPVSHRRLTGQAARGQAASGTRLLQLTQ